MIVQRKLTETEALRLHEELKTTPNILGYTVKELRRFKNVFVAEVEGNFAGACISKDLRWRWTDIAVLYVLPAFRGRGLGRALYAAAWDRAQQQGRHIYTLSRSPEVIHLMKLYGMELNTSLLKAPLAIHLHMNSHLMSWYRIKEALRKSRALKTDVPFISGTKRAPK